MKNPKLTILFTFVSIISCSLGYAQMAAGKYPFQIVDSLVFEKSPNWFQIDTASRPYNFISTSEAFFYDRVELQIGDTSYNWQQIKAIHKETNDRDFIAGISNHSSDTILIPIQDNSAIAIIEAIDHNGHWRPIQFWPISGCGNSYYSQTTLPNQSLLITVKKTFGDKATQMRIRLHGTDTIMISPSFAGWIDESMFNIGDSLIYDYKHILCDSIFFLESPYYRNLNYDDLEFIEFPEE